MKNVSLLLNGTGHLMIKEMERDKGQGHLVLSVYQYVWPSGP